VTRRWYVVRTESRADHLAAYALGLDEFEVFSPRVKIASDRVGKSDAPLFPGYLFLRFDPEVSGWPVFRSAHRILGFVRFGGEFPWLPDIVVEQLADRVDAINSGDGLWRRFRKGETVRVVSGKLESLAVIVEEAKSPQSRAKVLLEFMGRLVQAQVPWQHLSPSEDGSSNEHTALRRTRGRGRWIRGYGSRATANA